MHERAAFTDRMNAPEFWNNPKAAQKTIEESKIIRAQIEPLEEAVKSYLFNSQLLTLADGTMALVCRRMTQFLGMSELLGRATRSPIFIAAW